MTSGLASHKCLHVHTCILYVISVFRLCAVFFWTGLPNVKSLKTRLLALEVLRTIVIGSRAAAAAATGSDGFSSEKANAEDSQYTPDHCYEVSSDLCMTEQNASCVYYQ